MYLVDLSLIDTSNNVFMGFRRHVSDVSPVPARSKYPFSYSETYLFTAPRGTYKPLEGETSRRWQRFRPVGDPEKNNPEPHQHKESEQATFRPHAGIRTMRQTPSENPMEYITSGPLTGAIQQGEGV